MTNTRAAPTFPVQFNEHAIAEDLTHHSSAAHEALDLFRREIDQSGGLSLSRLKRCDEQARDGTRLAGCVKTYVPWPIGRFGLVFLPVAHPTRPLALRAFAYGVRHPGASKPSVYEIADRRYNSESA